MQIARGSASSSHPNYNMVIRLSYQSELDQSNKYCSTAEIEITLWRKQFVLFKNLDSKIYAVRLFAQYFVSLSTTVIPLREGSRPSYNMQKTPTAKKPMLADPIHNLHHKPYAHKFLPTIPQALTKSSLDWQQYANEEKHKRVVFNKQVFFL
ncbi:hypothetical protein G9A89_023416 [Geosiphon pyriformis]|nr:hypothetical protein G9A89_023416 [Geosiphon pyriformis]